MPNKYTDLFNSIIAPHLHALVNTVSECKRVKILVRVWDREIEMIWPGQAIEIKESTSDVIARLSFWVGGLRDKFDSGLSRKRVIQILDDVFYVSLRFYFEFGANEYVERLIEKFCKSTDKWMGEKVLAPKLASFKHKIKQNIKVESAPAKGPAPIVTIIAPPKPPTPIITPKKPEEIDEPPIDDDEPSKPAIKWPIIISAMVILLVVFAVFWFNQPQGAVTTIKTQLVNKTIPSNVPQSISFSEYFDNADKYPDGTTTDVRGFLKYGLPTAATSGVLVYFIVDDLGNEITLADLTEDQKKLIPRGKTTDVYEVSGRIKRKFDGLKIEVSQITLSARPTTIINRQITIQENVTQTVTQSMSNAFTALVISWISSPQINCTDGTIANSCSVNKPYFCKKGELTEKPDDCGCPLGQRKYEGKCIPSVQCSDGTLEPECAKKQPYQCIGGKLVSKAGTCGCPPDHLTKGDSCVKIQRCMDGTLYGECSDKNPFFCNDGSLIESATACGCPYDQVAQGDRCVSEYEVNPKEVHLEYILRGQRWSIDYVVYQGLSDYLSSLPRSYYCSPTCPSKVDLEIKYIEESNQRQYLEPLVKAIQKQTPNKDDQARIAISIVQNIPYDWEGFKTGNINGKYPYEVLTEQKGVCGEKSKLLAFLLRELGFGVVLFEYPEQTHQAVGIKCPAQYSHRDTGYCFVESTRPSIITDDQNDYLGVGKLTTLEMMQISEGNSLDSVSEEFADAQKMIQINQLSKYNGNILDEWAYSDWRRLIHKYGIQFTGFE